MKLLSSKTDTDVMKFCLVAIVLLLTSCSSLSDSRGSDLYDPELGEARRQAALEVFAAIELPDGLEWSTPIEVAEPEAEFANQNNPTPGMIDYRMEVPTDRAPEVWMNELDEAFRATGQLEGYKFKSNELQPCDEPFRRSYRHTKTHDLLSVLYDPDSLSHPLTIYYRYTSAKHGGTFDLPGDVTETWASPACS